MERKKMRKKTAKYIFEKLMWLTLMFLPVITFTIVNIKTKAEITNSNTINDYIISYNDYIGNYWGNVELGVIQNAIEQFTSLIVTETQGYKGIIWQISWFVFIEIIHLATDILCFIPRLVHKWVDKICLEEKEK